MSRCGHFCLDYCRQKFSHYCPLASPWTGPFIYIFCALRFLLFFDAFCFYVCLPPPFFSPSVSSSLSLLPAIRLSSLPFLILFLSLIQKTIPICHYFLINHHSRHSSCGHHSPLFLGVNPRHDPQLPVPEAEFGRVPRSGKASTVTGSQGGGHGSDVKKAEWRGGVVRWFGWYRWRREE